ncbi:MAG: lipoyl synthase, partial [Acidimicrobiia bacterium]|nr:lipoyl synthase [Acidimicrobiia bacterium]
KSGIMLGLGETLDEVSGALNDLAAVGVKIVTVGQYLRPSEQHLPVVRWWSPEEFAKVARIGEAAGINHVESGPLVRSSYHARSSAEAAGSSAVLATGLTR